jgi:hypothetical protein
VAPVRLRILVLVLIAFALSNFARSQGTGEPKQDAAGETAKAEVRTLIREFERAVKTRDFEARPLLQ